VKDNSLGLVLSGGGAKGAYQVGVLKAMLELDVAVDVISGASIGALNGAILASAPSLEVGVERMEEVWCRLAESSPLKHNFPFYLTLLVAAGLHLHPLSRIVSKFLPLHSFDRGLFADDELKKMMDEYIKINELQKGLPLFVSIYRSHGALYDGGRWLLGQLGIDTPDSEFKCVQQLPKDEQKEALLASAAIPLLLALRQVEGIRYSDGGQGGVVRSQGNTPITPLLERGCKTVIVTHLSDGALWSRHDFPDATIVEIRPQRAIQRDNAIKDMLAFGTEHIPSWIAQGYEDALHCLKRIARATSARKKLQQSEALLTEHVSKTPSGQQRMREAMQKLTASNDDNWLE
jgi:NTE family protein